MPVFKCESKSNTWKKCLIGLGINMETGEYELLFSKEDIEKLQLPFYYEFRYCPYCSRQLVFRPEFNISTGDDDVQGYPV